MTDRARTRFQALIEQWRNDAAYQRSVAATGMEAAKRLTIADTAEFCANDLSALLVQEAPQDVNLLASIIDAFTQTALWNEKPRLKRVAIIKEKIRAMSSNGQESGPSSRESGFDSLRRYHAIVKAAAADLALTDAEVRNIVRFISAEPVTEADIKRTTELAAQFGWVQEAPQEEEKPDDAIRDAFTRDAEAVIKDAT